MLWIKMYPARCLRGSLRFDLPFTKRGIWYELLLIAGDLDEDGIIDYPIQFIASQLGCPVKVLEEVLTILERTERITRNGTEIVILNWFKYQSPTTKKGRVAKPRKSRAEKAAAFREEMSHQDEVVAHVSSPEYEYTDEDEKADQEELFRNTHPDLAEEHEAALYDKLHPTE